MTFVIVAVAAVLVLGPCSRTSRPARPLPGASEDATRAATPPEAHSTRDREPEPARVSRLPEGCSDVCDCCASRRDCGDRGCGAPLAGEERFGLRVELSRTRTDASVRPTIRVCARDGDGGSSHCAGSPDFSVSIDELVTRGLELAIELPVDSETGVFRRPIVLKETLRIEPPTTAALCRGLSFELPDLPIEKPALYLEPIGSPAPAECGAR